MRQYYKNMKYLLPSGTREVHKTLLALYDYSEHATPLVFDLEEETFDSGGMIFQLHSPWTN